MHRIAFALALTASLFACTPERDTFDPNSCSAGATVDCACDGGVGHATCAADGSGYGACLCGPLPCDGGTCATDGGQPDAGHPFCTPQATSACTCPDDRSGTQTCNGSGTAYGFCVCEGAQSCSASSLVATGSLTWTSGTIDYSTTEVVASFQHYLGAGSGAGCIGVAHLALALQQNVCPLTLDFGAVATGFGGLTQVSLVVDSACSELTGLSAGTYTGTPGYGLVTLNLGTGVPDTFTAHYCLTSEFISFSSGAFQLKTTGGTTVTVSLGTLNLTGDVYSVGAATAACYDASSCAPDYRSIGASWCKEVSCGSGQHDGGDGTCVANGTCSGGFHNGGDGTCVALESCISGYHDGGDGTCKPNGTCASGYHDGGQGSCSPTGTCDFGFHDGGNGSCVEEGACATNYLPDTEGTCIPAGDCSNAPTVARTGSDRSVGTGFVVTLDGSASTGVPSLTYLWALVDRPAGSTAHLSSTSGATVSFTPDMEGDYVAELSVTDARQCMSSAALVTLHAVNRLPSVTVTVTWDSDHGDADLHYLAPGGVFKTAPLDCYYANKTPDWGPFGLDGLTANDPSLGTDARWGGAAGETIQQDELFDGVFTPEVHYFCAHQSGGTSMLPITATIHVLVNGTEVFSQQRSLLQGAVWPAASISVSGGGSQVDVSASPLQPFTPANSACL